MGGRAFSRWLRFEVAEEVERAIFTARVKPVRRAGKKAEDVGLVVAVQVDDEIKLLLPHLRDEFCDASDRNQCWPIAQRHAIDFEDLIGEPSEIQQLFARLADRNGDLCIAELLAYRPQRG